MKYLMKFSVLLCMMIFVLSACSKVPAVNDPVNGTETSGYISWTELNAGPYWDSCTEDITYHMDVGEGSNTDVSFGNKIFAAVFVNWTYEQEMAKNDWYDINTFEKYGMPVDDNGNACVLTKVLLIYDYSGNLIADISLNELVGDFYESPLIFIDQEDQIHVWISMTAVDTKLTTYYHLVFDDKGNVLSRIPLFVDQYYFCFDICYDLKSGLSALVRNDKFERGLICFDDSGKMKSCGAEMACNCTAIYYINGEAMGRFDVWSEVDLTVQSALVPLERMFSSGFDQEIYLDTSIPDSAFSINEGIIYIDERQDSVMLWLYDNGEIIRIADLDGLDIGIYPTYIHVNVAGEVTLIGTGFLDLQYGMATIKSCTDDPDKDRQIVNISGVGITDDPIIEYMKFSFNNSHDDYKIELVDYSCDSDDSDEALAMKMANDLIYRKLEGTSPDIIVDTKGVFPFYSVSSSDYLVDLDPYLLMVAKDQDIQEWIVQGTEIQGKQYALPLGYQIGGFIVDEEDLSKSQNWNFKTFEEIDSSFDGIMFSGFSSEELLIEHLKMSFYDYFDIENRKVSFNSDDFINLLKWAYKYGKTESESDKTSILKQDRYCEYVKDASVQTLYLKSEENRKYMDIVGFPSNDSTCLTAFPLYRFAITSECQYPDIAWDFIRCGLDKTAQNAIGRVMFPVDNRALSYAEDYTMLYYLRSKNTMDSAVNGKILEKMLSRVNCVAQTDPELFTIIEEEAVFYFSDAKSVDEVANIIQNRAEIIMHERYD